MKNGTELFRGKNIITYRPDHFSRDDAILNFLTLKRRNTKEKSVMYDIRLKGSKITSTENMDLYEDKFSWLNRKIKSIKLTTPILRSDRRWKSIGLTTSALFLGSALTGGSFRVKTENITLPYSGGTGFFENIDVSGFTLFEDIFPEFKKFISTHSPGQNIITAAGGPFVSLNPIGAFYHLPEINLFIRGESEFVFPEILKALNKNNIPELLNNRGFIYQEPGLIIISDYNEINIPTGFKNLKFDFSFADKKDLNKGLEINFSRGCRNNCIFCSKVQGRRLRKLPFPVIDQLFKSYSERLEELNIRTEHSKILNINDDDILQDIEYAGSVFDRVIKNKFSLWGIQSSISSFFNERGEIENEKINLISRKELYQNRFSLLWIGTDTFLKTRGIRLGKHVPEKKLLYSLVEKFEDYDVDNYHYWISSDHMSSWGEFFKELILIYDLYKKYSRFAVLANSPFLIPYPSTGSYKFISRSENSRDQIIYKKILKGNDPVFELILVDKVVTRYAQLNRLLKNEILPGREGFFDYMKRGDIVNAIITAYSFLKEERILLEISEGQSILKDLSGIEKKVERFITKIV